MESADFIVPLGSDPDVIEEDEENQNDAESSMEERLDNFRLQWKQELKNPSPIPSKRQVIEKEKAKNSPAKEKSGRQLDDVNANQEEKAKNLFMEGVNSERKGDMYAAIQYYRHAIQLVPDIEFRISDFSSNTGSSEPSVDGEEDADQDLEDLTENLGSLSIDDIKNHCEPQFSQQDTHISALPVELLLILFRWVVSSELDLRSLEQLSRVCRGFYVCARDQELWRESCLRVYGKSCILTKEYVDWRHMYLTRPHLQFNGVYISKNSYFRQGEPGIDNYYRPWHLVEYYRYIRAFPDGFILMYNTPDEPSSIVGKLRHRNCPLPGVMVGHYRIVDNVVTAVLHKENTKEYDPILHKYTRRKHRISKTLPETELTFHVELEVCSSANRIYPKLEFKQYTLHTRYRSTGNSNVAEFDTYHFSPLYFSRVKSYTTASIAPL